MSSFDKCRLVEAEGLAILRPFLDERANGRLVMLDKGPLARALQQTTGDCIFQCPKGRAWSVEIKTEEKHTGNLFLESWSNRNLVNPDSHAERGSNPGWLFTNRADLLMYYFLDTDQLYVMDLLKLKRWAFIGWRVLRYPERRQRKSEQLNDSWGWCVPIADLDYVLGERSFRVLNPKKMAAENTFVDCRVSGLPVHGYDVHNKAGHGLHPVPGVYGETDGPSAVQPRNDPWPVVTGPLRPT